MPRHQKYPQIAVLNDPEMMRLCCKDILFDPCHAHLPRECGGKLIGVGNIKIGKCEVRIVVSLASALDPAILCTKFGSDFAHQLCVEALTNRLIDAEIWFWM